MPASVHVAGPDRWTHNNRSYLRSGSPCEAPAARPCPALRLPRVLLWLLLILPVPAMALSSDTEEASSGYYTLSWEARAAGVELQEADNPDFSNARTLYRGHDTASLISGKTDGDWYYRLRAQDQAQWSEPVKVIVAHHDLNQAFGFLGLGLVVFLATLALIVHGAGRRESL